MHTISMQPKKELAKEDAFYDWVLYLMVPIHLYLIYYFLTTIADPNVGPF